MKFEEQFPSLKEYILDEVTMRGELLYRFVKTEDIQEYCLDKKNLDRRNKMYKELKEAYEEGFEDCQKQVMELIGLNREDFVVNQLEHFARIIDNLGGK